MSTNDSANNGIAKALLDGALDRACIVGVNHFGGGLIALYWHNPRQYQATLRRLVLGASNIDPNRPLIDSLAATAHTLETEATAAAGLDALTLLYALYSDPDTFLSVVDGAVKNFLLNLLNRGDTVNMVIKTDENGLNHGVLRTNTSEYTASAGTKRDIYRALLTQAAMDKLAAQPKNQPTK